MSSKKKMHIATKVIHVGGEPDKETGAKLEELTRQILNNKANQPDSNTADLEFKIDNLVYQIYGLTKEEIKLIEKE